MPQKVKINTVKFNAISSFFRETLEDGAEKWYNYYILIILITITEVFKV